MSNPINRLSPRSQGAPKYRLPFSAAALNGKRYFGAPWLRGLSRLIGLLMLLPPWVE